MWWHKGPDGGYKSDTKSPDYSSDGNEARVDDRRRQELGVIKRPRTKMSAHASKGMRLSRKYHDYSDTLLVRSISAIWLSVISSPAG